MYFIERLFAKQAIQLFAAVFLAPGHLYIKYDYHGTILAAFFCPYTKQNFLDRLFSLQIAKTSLL